MDTKDVATGAPISVAVSGGGQRATVWAFGAVSALVEHGLADEVVCISSVSGGSIANGVLAEANAANPGIYADTERYAGAIRPALEVAADRGLFPVGAPTGRWVAATFALLFAAMISFVGLLAAIAVSGRSDDPVHWLIGGAIVAVVLAFALRGVKEFVAPRDKPADSGVARRAFLVAPTFVLVTAVVWGTAALMDVIADGWNVLVIAAWFVLMVLFGAMAKNRLRRRGMVVRDALADGLLRGPGGRVSLAKVENPTLHHVMCATDLESGDHFYLTPRRLYGFREGTSAEAPKTVSLAAAVQASAALPAAFPAVTIETGPFEWTPPTDDPDAPHLAAGVDRVVLADGGVYNNMADQWERGLRGRLEAVPALEDVQQPARLLIMANASGAWEWKPFDDEAGFLSFETTALQRGQGVQYDVSTARRRRAAVSEFRSTESALRRASRDGRDLGTVDGLIGTLAMIDRSPWTIVEAFLPDEGDAPDSPREHRAVEARDFLDREAEEHGDDWDAIARRNADVATTLDAIGRSATLELLRHSYMLVSVGLYVLHGIGALTPFPKEAFAWLEEADIERRPLVGLWRRETAVRGG
ncbi:MAG: hypothetical protein AAF548_08250 [Actinomycetota bacterium]